MQQKAAQAIAGRCPLARGGQRQPRRARLIPAASIVPHGPQPGAAPPASLPNLPGVNTEVVFTAPALLAQSFSTLQAPQLITDVIDANATQPHWGSKVFRDAMSLQPASELLQAMQPRGIGELARLLSELQDTLADSLRQLSSLLQLPEGGLQKLVSSEASSSLHQAAAQLQVAAAARQAASSSLGSLELPGGNTGVPASSQLTGQLEQLPNGYAGYSLQTLGLIAAGMAAVIALSVPRDDEPSSGGGNSGGSGGGRMGNVSASSLDSTDLLPTSWDTQAVSSYYGMRPTLVVQRVLHVASEAVGYGTALLVDMASGSLVRNQAQRANQAMSAIERLGPAYVKVAQALSTRVDLLPPAYLVAIQRLQDRVPPFPDAVAYACIERAFGAPLGQVFSQLSSTSIAAASLGQVYRGTLRSSGQEVAIKVRRPDVLETVSLDLYLMRGLAMWLISVPEVKSDWVGIIDAWAQRFLDEMNYLLEAANTRQFAVDMASLPGVVIPDVVEEGTTTDVLVTSWVDGERLSESSASDVRELCDTLLSAYLIQLLDTGLLHADPHVGNLMRTRDGHIAILDHGLIQEVPRDYSLALMEYIAHLSVGDWDGLVDDLVQLGFVENVHDKAKLVEPLSIILTALSAGGGAQKVDIALVSKEIDKLSQQFEFKVPPYFALILRTFSMIEGIALQSDPNYSIVRECFPYLSRRLLTDDNPRAREALRQLLFAGGDTISLERVEKMMQGISSFTVDGLATTPSSIDVQGASGSQRQVAAVQQQVPLLDSTAKEVLAAVFSQRPTYIQEVLVEQAVSTTDAAARQLAALLISPLLGNLAAVQAAMQSNGQMGNAPLAPTLALLTRLPSLMQLSLKDQEQLQTAQGIKNLLLQNQPLRARLTVQQTRQLAQELAPLLPQLLPGIFATSQLFMRQLGQRAYSRVAAVMANEKRGSEYTALD